MADIIKDINILGDYFLVGDLEEGLLRNLRNQPLQRENLESVLPEELGNIILNLHRSDLVNILLNNVQPQQKA